METRRGDTSVLEMDETKRQKSTGHSQAFLHQREEKRMFFFYDVSCSDPLPRTLGVILKFSRFGRWWMQVNMEMDHKNPSVPNTAGHPAVPLAH